MLRITSRIMALAVVATAAFGVPLANAEVKQVASKKRRKRRKASGTATKSGEGDKKGGKKKLNIKLGGDGITF